MLALLDRKLAGSDKPALVIFMGAFEGNEDATALWADMKVDTRHANDFSRIAVVADRKWIEWGTKAAALVIGTKLNDSTRMTGTPPSPGRATICQQVRRRWRWIRPTRPCNTPSDASPS